MAMNKNKHRYSKRLQAQRVDRVRARITALSQPAPLQRKIFRTNGDGHFILIATIDDPNVNSVTVTTTAGTP